MLIFRTDATDSISCRLLATFNPPYHVQNDWTDLQIGVCTGPVAGWKVI